MDDVTDIQRGLIKQGRCPHCGSSSEIYSFYRDGGSTLYHAPCGRNRTWPNPNWSFGRKKKER